MVVISAGDGRVVFRRTISVTELNNGLNAVIGGFAKGLYVVQLRNGKNEFKGKIVKQ